ncbi:hypothetical protein BDZ91DRAFT_723218 [Kalaharituber pfeilii]|nr:hypothetical protein BDZ91DRAFT_723218 [Kalaharituber pfeilii]
MCTKVGTRKISGSSLSGEKLIYSPLRFVFIQIYLTYDTFNILAYWGWKFQLVVTRRRREVPHIL